MQAKIQFEVLDKCLNTTLFNCSIFLQISGSLDEDRMCEIEYNPDWGTDGDSEDYKGRVYCCKHYLPGIYLDFVSFIKPCTAGDARVKKMNNFVSFTRFLFYFLICTFLAQLSNGSKAQKCFNKSPWGNSQNHSFYWKYLDFVYYYKNIF